MIGVFLVWYFTSTSFLAYYMLFNFPLAIFVYLSSLKYFNPKPFNFKDASKTELNFHNEYPAFNRHENPVGFGRIYFGLVSFFWVKFLSIFFILIIYYIIVKIKFKGRDPATFSMEEQKVVKKLSHFFVKLLYVISGIVNVKKETRREKVTAVYKKYLGDSFDYDKEMNSDEFCTYICNHIGWLDIFYFCSETMASFAAKASVFKTPLIGKISNHSRVVWIDRADKNNKHKAFEVIEQRLEDIKNKKILHKCLYFLKQLEQIIQDSLALKRVLSPSYTQ